MIFDAFATTDYHCHILPYMDHGCVNEAMAEDALRAASETGIRCICATSHFYPDESSVDAFLEKRNAIFPKIEEMARTYGIRLLPGAEVQIQEHTETAGDVSRLAIGDTGTILLELPFTRTIHQAVYEHIFRLKRDSGLLLVLAHPDRYPKEATDTCLELGCVLQLNSESFLQIKTKHQYSQWLKRAPVFAIGTDFHQDARTSYSSFKKAVKMCQRHDAD